MEQASLRSLGNGIRLGLENTHKSICRPTMPVKSRLVKTTPELLGNEANACLLFSPPA
jgi:hypothetical protein